MTRKHRDNVECDGNVMAVKDYGKALRDAVLETRKLLRRCGHTTSKRQSKLDLDALLAHLNEYTPGDWAGWDRDQLLELRDRLIKAEAVCSWLETEMDSDLGPKTREALNDQRAAKEKA